MGMFDYITYKGEKYQTKDTPNQIMDNYEIREDGTLWVEEYDAEWKEDKEAWFGGFIEEFNHHWEKVENFTGEIRFYRHLDKDYNKWEEFSAYFVKSQLKHLETIESPSN